MCVFDNDLSALQQDNLLFFGWYSSSIPASGSRASAYSSKNWFIPFFCGWDMAWEIAGRSFRRSISNRYALARSAMDGFETALVAPSAPFPSLAPATAPATAPAPTPRSFFPSSNLSIGGVHLSFFQFLHTDSRSFKIHPKVLKCASPFGGVLFIKSPALFCNWCRLLCIFSHTILFTSLPALILVLVPVLAEAYRASDVDR